MTGRYDTRDTREGRLTELLVTLGVTEPDHVSVEPEGGIARVAAALFVSVSGFALLIPNVTPLVSGGEPPIGIALSVLGTVLSVALVLVGGLLYRSTFTTRNAVRIAVWSLFGIVVLGGIMLGIIRYQAQLGTPMVAPTFTVAKVLSIGAVAHVIIGVYDARRVRAQQLANEQRRVSVLNRMIRHNLRNETTVLGGHASLIAERVDDPELRDSAEAVAKSAAVIGGLAKDANRLQAAFERRPDARGAVPVEPLIEDAAEAAPARPAPRPSRSMSSPARRWPTTGSRPRSRSSTNERARTRRDRGRAIGSRGRRRRRNRRHRRRSRDPRVREPRDHRSRPGDATGARERARALIVRATADAFDGWLSIETRRAGDEGASDDETGTTVTIGVPAP